MSKHQRIAFIAVPVLILAIVAGACVHWLRFRQMELIRGSLAAKPTAAPEAALILTSDDIVQMAAPFRSKLDGQAVSGNSIELPQGAGDSGTVHFSVSPPTAGVYTCWAQVKWDDACGNSFLLRTGAGRGFTVGQDAVYNRWHWVPGGRHTLSTGETAVVVEGREDGIALRSLILSSDPNFTPDAAGLGLKPNSEPLRFGDAFDRSPGHGLGDWRALSGDWSIHFTLDPNRIPDQYALHVRSEDSPAQIVIDRPRWNGCRLACSFKALGPGQYGVMLDHDPTAPADVLTVMCDTSDSNAVLRISDAGETWCIPLGSTVREGQWHRLVVERWAWAMRVRIDGRLVASRVDVIPRIGEAGLAAIGDAVFDDVSCEELFWMAEDAGDFDVPWHAVGNARWYRPRSGKDDVALVGRRGSLVAETARFPIEEVLIEECGSPVVVNAPGLAETEEGFVRAFHAEAPCFRLAIERGEGPVAIRRLAILLDTRHEDMFRDGPYDFSEAHVPDASDYLDFTEAEYRAIETSGDREKLVRKARLRPVLARRAQHSVWTMDSGRWRLRDGALLGSGPDATLRFHQEVNVSIDVSLRVRLADANSIAAVMLYERAGKGVEVELRPCADQERPHTNRVALALEPVVWHAISIRVTPDTFIVQMDDGDPVIAPVERGVGGGILLSVPRGEAEFDDVELRMKRSRQGERLYAFDRRETDWWRKGEGWLDHGGIACALASQWISLVSPQGEGMLIQKQAFGSDILVAFNIEENSDWMGWNHDPTHVHHPADNVCVLLTTDDGKESYRLEINADQRTATVLYRNGKRVAAVPQDEFFPIEYMGAHSPYQPRRSRILLAKRNDELVAVVNGWEVLSYRDPAPLAVSRVAIGGHDTRINFSRVEIREL